MHCTIPVQQRTKGPSAWFCFFQWASSPRPHLARIPSASLRLGTHAHSHALSQLLAGLQARGPQPPNASPLFFLGFPRTILWLADPTQLRLGGPSSPVACSHVSQAFLGPAVITQGTPCLPTPKAQAQIILGLQFRSNNIMLILFCFYNRPCMARFIELIKSDLQSINLIMNPKFLTWRSLLDINDLIISLYTLNRHILS